MVLGFTTWAFWVGPFLPALWLHHDSLLSLSFPLSQRKWSFLLPKPALPLRLPSYPTSSKTWFDTFLSQLQYLLLSSPLPPVYKQVPVSHNGKTNTSFLNPALPSSYWGTHSLPLTRLLRKLVSSISAITFSLLFPSFSPYLLAVWLSAPLCHGISSDLQINDRPGPSSALVPIHFCGGETLETSFHSAVLHLLLLARLPHQPLFSSLDLTPQTHHIAPWPQLSDSQALPWGPPSSLSLLLIFPTVSVIFLLGWLSDTQRLHSWPLPLNLYILVSDAVIILALRIRIWILFIPLPLSLVSFPVR